MIVILVGILFKEDEIHIVIYEGLCFDVAQGRLNGAPNEKLKFILNLI